VQSKSAGEGIVSGSPKASNEPKLKGQIRSAPETPQAHEAAAEVVRYVMEIAERRREERRKKREDDRHDISRDAA
jgi:hypothetical protein